MPSVRIAGTTIVVPGDLRQLKSGDEIVLTESAAARKDWTGILTALPTAIARGANVRWEK